jgi:exonuclease SbcC
MKILRIHLKNLNSLRGAHEVDLEDERIARAGLFAITGPTGAGKSTLLDAITLALYGRAARYGKQANPEDMMSRHEAECQAEVDFEVAQGRYRAVWHLRRARGVADGNLQPAKRYLYDADGQVLASKINEVSELVEELSGLDYDRFTRSVLLAQGEFAKFLKASDDERAALLESLTRTAIYSDLGRLVYEEVQSREKLLASAEESLALIPILSPEDLAGLQAEITQGETDLATQRQAHDQNLQALGLARQWIELTGRKARLEAERSAWQRERETAAAQFARLIRHRAAQPHISELTRWTEAVKHEETVSRSLDEAESACTRAQLLWQAHWQESTGSNEVPAGDDAALEGALGAIEASLALLDDAASRFRELAAPDPIPDPATLQTELASLLAMGGETGLQNRADEEARRELRLEQLGGLIEQRARITERRDASKRAHEQITGELDIARTRLTTASEKLKLATELANSREDLLQAARRIASLESQRARLVKGEPCPLCGSLEHPWHDGQAPDDLADREGALREAQAQRKAAEEERNEADRGVAALQAKLQTLAASLESTSAEFSAIEQRVLAAAQELGLDAVPEEVEAARQRARAAAEEARHLCAQFIALRQAEEWLRRRDRVELEQGRLRALLLPHGVTLPAASGIGALLGKLSGRAKAYRDYETSRRDRAALLALRETARSARDAVAATLATSLEGSGFATAEELREAVLPVAEAERIATWETQLGDLGKELDVRWRDCVEALTALQSAGCQPVSDMQPLEAAVQQSEEAIGAIRTRLGAVRQRLAEDAENRQCHAARSARLEEEKGQLATWRRLRHLIGDASGKKFRTFAQGISLDLMVRHANRHLARLTSRYQLRRAPGSELGLEIEDNFQAGVRRPTASLSGGESFLASLAMALGLAGLAGRNVRIDSLFIDEGFGSLDAEALEIALAALESLRQEDKLVGIISHVGLLQERIGAQVVVEKRADGTSALEIATGTGG